MGEISNDIKAAEEALSRALSKVKEIPAKERSETCKYWMERVQKSLVDIKNLNRLAIVFDIAYVQKRRKP